MGKIVLVDSMSLDGAVRAPGPDSEAPESFAHGGWSQPHRGDHPRYAPDTLAAGRGSLLGWSQHEVFVASWLTVTEPTDVTARALSNRPDRAVSTTSHRSERGPTSLLSASRTGGVATLRAASDQDVVMIDSSRLAQTLIDLSLVDEGRLWLRPVKGGSRKRSFPAWPDPHNLRLVDGTPTAQVFVLGSDGRPVRLETSAATVAEGA